MTDFTNYRTFPRQPIHSAIRIRVHGEDELVLPATVKNYSKNGLFFETSVCLETGAMIEIETPIPEIPESGWNSYNGNAKAIWCRSLPVDGKTEAHKTGHYYGIGARLLSVRCDWCNETLPCGKLRRTPESVVFCAKCYEAFMAETEGELKQSIYRHLLGNIL